MLCPGYEDTSFVSFTAGKHGLQRQKTPQGISEPKQSMTPLASLAPHDLQFVSWPQDDLCVAYARACLPKFWCDVLRWQLKPTNDPRLNPRVEENLVSYTLLSLARALFAYRFRQEALHVEAVRLYTQVVSILQHALLQPQAIQRLETLEAILALRAFDVSYCTKTSVCDFVELKLTREQSFIPCHVDAWVLHSLGTERILQICGPHAYRDPVARALLEHARPLIVLTCLRKRKSTILAHEEWKTVPWSESTTSKSHIEHLMDIFVDVPSALYQQSTVPGKQGQSAEVSSKMQVRALLILQRLELWRSDWTTQVQRQAVEIDLGHPAGLEFRTLWPKIMGFSSLEHANAFALYCAVSLLTINAAFGQALETLDCTQCIQKHDPSTFEHMFASQPPHLDVDGIDVVQLFHLTIAGSCGLISYYLYYATPKPPPIEILISLRHVWLATRRLKCPMATWFDRAMEKILTSPAADLPLYLYTERPARVGLN